MDNELLERIRADVHRHLQEENRKTKELIEDLDQYDGMGHLWYYVYTINVTFVQDIYTRHISAITLHDLLFSQGERNQLAIVNDMIAVYNETMEQRGYQGPLPLSPREPLESIEWDENNPPF